jgi:dTMP kinase
MERVKARGTGELDRMERETLAFFQAVREGYLRLAATEPNRFIVIDGDQAPETLESEIWDVVTQRLT